MTTTQKSNFKLGKDSLTYLLIKKHGGIPFKRYSIDKKTPQCSKLGIDRLERIFIDRKPFDWAVLYSNVTNQIIAYYHPKTQTKQLNKTDFTALNKANEWKIYIIYTQRYKLKTGRTSRLSLPIDDLSDVQQYWNRDTQRIMVYNNGQHTHNFMKGQFFKV